jgi:hypothetical protein
MYEENKKVPRSPVTNKGMTSQGRQFGTFTCNKTWRQARVQTIKLVQAQKVPHGDRKLYRKSDAR